MKTHTTVALVIILITLGLCPMASADKSFNVRSPRGNRVNLMITSCALKTIRIYNLEFSEDGDTFSLMAAPNGSADAIKGISIEFHADSIPVKSEFVDIGPGKTMQEVYCPESFDEIVIDCFGY